MIIYQANKHFFKDIWNFTRSWTMVKLMRGVLFSSLYAAAICVIIFQFDLLEQIPINTTIFSLIGVVLSLLLVFRTNTAYDRWWEGRKQWGKLVNDSRNLAIMTKACLPEELKGEKHKMATLIANFSISLRDHLRDGVKVGELINLSSEQHIAYQQISHIPSQIALEIQTAIQLWTKKGWISENDNLNFKPHSMAFMDVAGACERIKKTPILFSYAVFLKLFILIYGVLLPITLVETFHYYTIILEGFIIFAFLGIELMAEEIEDPFGLDCNDLPTSSIGTTIKNNVFEILTTEHIKPAKQELYQKIF